jgi:hypothetical protein
MNFHDNIWPQLQENYIETMRGIVHFDTLGNSSECDGSALTKRDKYNGKNGCNVMVTGW